MKTKLKNIIFIILISGIIISCHCKDTYQNVSEENKIIYQQDELVIFKSNLGNSDTFRINIEKSYDNIDSGPCGLLAKQQTNYKEIITTVYINIRTNIKEGAIYQKVNISNGYEWKDAQPSNYTVLYNNYTINNQVYNQVYYDSVFFSFNSIPIILKEAYFHRKYGILKYTYKTGEVWTIQN